jgi:hypothetical protein
LQQTNGSCCIPLVTFFCKYICIYVHIHIDIYNDVSNKKRKTEAKVFFLIANGRSSFVRFLTKKQTEVIRLQMDETDLPIFERYTCMRIYFTSQSP